MFILIACIISFWLGWVLRDRYICHQIRVSTEDVLGHVHALSGNALNHMRCLMIHERDQVEAIVDRFPVDPLVDESIVPEPVRRVCMRLHLD